MSYAVYCNKYRVLYLLSLQFYVTGYTRVCMTSLELGNTNGSNMHFRQFEIIRIRHLSTFCGVVIKQCSVGEQTQMAVLSVCTHSFDTLRLDALSIGVIMAAV
jgi:hypothetical protein